MTVHLAIEIGSYEAKTRLPELLRAVGSGQSFVITRHGKAVAELVPVGRGDENAARQAAVAMAKFMRSHRVRDVDIKGLIEEGRR